jgi:2-amino-4-hydroxy-6-hydroxymethyldihydropteridine diphosphokinase
MRRKLTPGHAFVALGANLPSESGRPEDTVRQAMAALMPLSQQLLVLSGLYLSEPKDCPPGAPLYCNAVVALLPKADEQPLGFLHKLQAIEQQHGRRRSGVVNESRSLDLDLLYYAGLALETPELTLPHPRAHTRRFVLQPWLEIAGHDWPLGGRTLGEWLLACEDPPLSRLDD